MLKINSIVSRGKAITIEPAGNGFITAIRGSDSYSQPEDKRVFPTFAGALFDLVQRLIPEEFDAKNESEFAMQLAECSDSMRKFIIQRIADSAEKTVKDKKDKDELCF